jgi:hypothetical protein
MFEAAPGGITFWLLTFPAGGADGEPPGGWCWMQDFLLGVTTLAVTEGAVAAAAGGLTTLAVTEGAVAAAAGGPPTVPDENKPGNRSAGVMDKPAFVSLVGSDGSSDSGKTIANSVCLSLSGRTSSSASS